MSHHLDTPLAAQGGQLYIDDLYVFDGNRATVFVMDVNSSVTKADIKRGFHAEGRYEIKIHVNGAEMEDLTYRFAFGELDGDNRQTFQLYELTGADARDDAAMGTPIAEGRTGEVTTGGNVRIWAGRIADPFFIDLDELATINGAVKDGSMVDRSAWRVDQAKNSFAGTTVESIVLEVSHDEPLLRDGTEIGVWCRTLLATDAGGWRQINRAGHPMMWPIFWPHDTDFSNPANFRHPSQDLTEDGEEIANAVAGCRRGERHRTGPPGVRLERRPTALPRHAVVQGRHGRELRLRDPQRAHHGGQRARGDVLPDPQHRHHLRAHPGGHQGGPCRLLPLRGPGLTRDPRAAHEPSLTEKSGYPERSDAPTSR